VPTDPFLYAVIALTLVYSAYVSEVYRAGIESIHPSQEAAARSLGLSRIQALRYVILPQAVRRVIPPLLNDFIGLQKDTVLVSVVGVVEAFRESSIIEAAHFNSTPTGRPGTRLPGRDDPAGALHGLARGATGAASWRTPDEPPTAQHPASAARPPALRSPGCGSRSVTCGSCAA
jgi:hypothetical protein